MFFLLLLLSSLGLRAAVASVRRLLCRERLRETLMHPLSPSHHFFTRKGLEESQEPHILPHPLTHTHALKYTVGREEWRLAARHKTQYKSIKTESKQQKRGLQARGHDFPGPTGKRKPNLWWCQRVGMKGSNYRNRNQWPGHRMTRKM